MILNPIIIKSFNRLFFHRRRGIGHHIRDPQHGPGVSGFSRGGKRIVLKQCRSLCRGYFPVSGFSGLPGNRIVPSGGCHRDSGLAGSPEPGRPGPEIPGPAPDHTPGAVPVPDGGKIRPGQSGERGGHPQNRPVPSRYHLCFRGGGPAGCHRHHPSQGTAQCRHAGSDVRGGPPGV